MIAKNIYYKFNQVINRFRVYKLRLLGMSVGNGCNIGKISVIGHERIKIGDNVTIQDNVRLTATGYSKCSDKFLITIEDHNFIGYGSVIESNKLVRITSYCMIGPYCYLTDSNHIHNLDDNPFPLLGGEYKNLTIKKNCWIGAHCVILPGVTINENSIIAANSTVLKDVNRGSLNAGSPTIQKRIYPII